MITNLPTKRISAILQWKTFIRVLPTRWRRKPASIEITSLSPYVGLYVIFKPKNFVKVASHTFTRVRFLISLFRLFLTHCSHGRYLSSRMLIRFIWQWIHSTQYYFRRRVGRPFVHKKWQSITGIATRSLLPALFHTLIFTISLLLSFIQVH